MEVNFIVVRDDGGDCKLFEDIEKAKQFAQNQAEYHAPSIYYIAVPIDLVETEIKTKWNNKPDGRSKTD